MVCILQTSSLSSGNMFTPWNTDVLYHTYMPCTHTYSLSLSHVHTASPSQEDDGDGIYDDILGTDEGDNFIAPSKDAHLKKFGREGTKKA